MKILSSLVFLFLVNYGYGQVVLSADGPGDTYELITSVLAPGHKPIEAPDCSHPEFDNHIDEIFDDELGVNVFRFHMHVSADNDRCINFDRQRNEIKSYDKSPDNLLGIAGEKVIYKWKFKLAAGFQSSPNFTHLHQLKSVGGPLASMPMYTLTTRKGSPDRLELRYAETNSQITLTRTDLAPFIDTWLSVIEKITYGENGTYSIVIQRLSDEETLFAYTNESIINWRPEAEFVRPKWGIYRSLINEQDLRDEEVRYADFSVEEVDLISSNNSATINKEAIVFNNPINNELYLHNLPDAITTIQIFSIDGKKIIEKNVDTSKQVQLDVSHLSKGTYLLNFNGKQLNYTELIVVH